MGQDPLFPLSFLNHGMAKVQTCKSVQKEPLHDAEDAPIINQLKLQEFRHNGEVCFVFRRLHKIGFAT